MTTAMHPGTGYRWRALTPDQGVAIHRAFKVGVRAQVLAQAYGVHVRTIYRTLRRSPEEIATVRVFDQQATFVKGEDGEPVRLTAWTPA